MPFGKKRQKSDEQIRKCIHLHMVLYSGKADINKDKDKIKDVALDNMQRRNRQCGRLIYSSFV